jgi:excinuclease ABC subunit A
LAFRIGDKNIADIARLTIREALAGCIIEHDLDVMAAADCLIDLGPEGSQDGGRVRAWGSPEEVAASEKSRTAPFLREYLAGHG